MKVGISRTAFARGASGRLRDDPWFFAKEAERLGFDSLWSGEHVVVPRTDENAHSYHSEGVPAMPSSIVRLAGVAAATTKLRIGTAILILPEHNPINLAKQLATLDADSNGRLSVGVGVGWNRQEMEVMGGHFDRRVAQTMDAVSVLKKLWSGEFVAHSGEFYQFPAIMCQPRPAQRPHPPLLFGMNTENAFARIVAHADGWLPSVYKPDEIRGAGIDRVARGREHLDKLCEQAGRDPRSVEITAIIADAPEDPLDRALLQRYADAGADRVSLLQSREANMVFASDAAASAWLERVAERTLG
ncbi:hydride transferase 1 [alpha proteobacterium U9-1i]|nr:hydride transferase 1 [alpha proteobacterium U9-1i]